MLNLISNIFNTPEATGSDVSSGGKSIFNSIIPTDYNVYGALVRDPTVAHFVQIVITALVLGVIMSLVYLKCTRKKPSANFAMSLVILPIVIAAVVFLVGNNLAAAFSLAGVFSITRFRSQAGSSKDLTFIFVSMAIGLACGTGYVWYGVLITIILAIILLILDTAEYGQQKTDAKVLRINVPESISYGEVFDPILEKYTYFWELVRVRTKDLGATFEITYNVTVKRGVNDKDFIDELRTRNGNMNIILRLDDKGDSRQI